MIEIDLCWGVGGSRVRLRHPDSKNGAAVVAALVERGWRQVTDVIAAEERAVLERPKREADEQIEPVRVLDADGFYADGDKRDEYEYDGC